MIQHMIDQGLEFLAPIEPFPVPPRGKKMPMQPGFGVVVSLDGSDQFKKNGRPYLVTAEPVHRSARRSNFDWANFANWTEKVDALFHAAAPVCRARATVFDKAEALIAPPVAASAAKANSAGHSFESRN